MVRNANRIRPILLLKGVLMFMYSGALYSQWTQTNCKYLDGYSFDSRSIYIVSSLHEHYRLSPFTQMIFSWNAIRPQKGYFEFYGRARDQGTQQWLPWHKMIVWGYGIHKSFRDEQKNSLYEYVRLELKSPADAFEIKIVGREGASFELLHAISVTTSLLKGLIHESAESLSSLTEKVLLHLPKKSQWQSKHSDAERICSPTSLSMVVSYLTGKKVDIGQFADNCYDQGLKVFGSWPFNIAHAFDYCKGKFEFSVKRLTGFEEVYNSLLKKLPVVVSVRGALKNAFKPVFQHGHLLVVVGYDPVRKKVICNDPGFKFQYQVFHSYDLKDFLAAWERSHRLAYVVMKNDKYKELS